MIEMHTITKNQSLVDNVRAKLISLAAFEGNPVTEARLAEEFNVSRTPIRDALKVLEREGLVERRQRRGVYLKELTAKEISDLYDARLAMEGFVARLVVSNATDEDIEFLAQAAADYEKAVKTQDAVAGRKADLSFHSKLIDIAGNLVVKDIMDNFRIMEQLFTVQLSHVRAMSLKRSPYSHSRIVEAIGSRDADRCEKLVTSHISWRKQRLLEALLGVCLLTGANGSEVGKEKQHEA